MFKKINQYLLVNFPLIWNLKFHILLPVALLTHLVFYLAGYLNCNSLSCFYDSDRYDFFREIEAGIYSFLVIVITIIIWLFFYLRNNAFKSFYPVKKSYLIKEFLLISFIILILISTIFSFKLGNIHRFETLSKNINYQKSLEIINQAKCFLAFEREDFNERNTCDSIRYRDSINSIVSDLPYIDSCDVYPNGDYTSIEETMEAAATEAIDENYSTRILPIEHYSYLFYCSSSKSISGDSSDYERYTKNAKRWILNKQKDSIKLCLMVYINLLKELNGQYSIDLEGLLNSILNDDVVSISNYFPYSYDRNYQVVQSLYSQNLEQSLEQSYLTSILLKYIENQETSKWRLFDWEIYFYFTLGISMLLMLFRLTRLKPWLISILSMGILAILGTIVGNLLGKSSLIVYLIAFSMVLFMAISFITKGKKKLWSAIFLNWFTFTFLSIPPIIMSFVLDQTREVKECIKQIMTVVQPEHPIHQWILNNKDLLLAGNVLFGFVVFIVVVIPLCYKWQSNSNE